jgi:hypothetical protein
LSDYTPHDLAEIFVTRASALKRGLGNGVTLESVSHLIDTHTDAELRSQLNGSIAEELLEKTECAMDERNGLSVPTHLIYELSDVTTGASSLRSDTAASSRS